MKLSKVITEERGEGRKFRIFAGMPKRNKPKTFKKVGGFIAEELRNNFNSGIVTVYKAKDGSLRYSTYRDGCFHEYYGRMEEIK